jgi:hypothetical protein
MHPVLKTGRARYVNSCVSSSYFFGRVAMGRLEMGDREMLGDRFNLLQSPQKKGLPPDPAKVTI